MDEALDRAQRNAILGGVEEAVALEGSRVMPWRVVVALTVAHPDGPDTRLVGWDFQLARELTPASTSWHLSTAAAEAIVEAE